MEASAVKNLLHETLRKKLNKLADEAKVRFSSLNAFPTSTWEDPDWLYQGKVKIIFIVKEKPNVELELLNKVFIVTTLWHSRSRKKPLGSSRVKNLATGVKMLGKNDVLNLYHINQDAYDRTLQYIKATYLSGESPCNHLNTLIDFLKVNKLLPQPIDTVRGSAQFLRADEHGRVALEQKLPLPELVRAIIHLKWAIDDQWDGSARAQLDMLAVLTQIFQYGLGLRMGEVLRLPKKCLIEKDNDLFCLVWTEKGSEPMARYVPTIWRPVLKDAVQRINSICEKWRAHARSIEDGTITTWLDSRFQRRVESIEADLAKTLNKLSALSTLNAEIAKERLSLLQPLADEELIELKRLGEYWPLASTAAGVDSLVKFYKNSGFYVVSKPTGSRKHKHYIAGGEFKRRIAELVEFRRNLITYNELFEILHGRPAQTRPVDSSYLIGLVRSRQLTLIEWFLVSGLKTKSGTGCLHYSYADAVTAITNVVTGGYEYRKLLPIFDAEQLYPELFNQKSMSSIGSGAKGGFYSYLELSGERRVFYRRSVTSKDLNYVSGYGFLLEYSSIQDAVINNFVAVNTNIDAELIEEIRKDFLLEGLDISSKAFNINQKVSDYLFVVPSALGGTYNELMPCIFSYHAVLFRIKPKTDGRKAGSVFTRYGVLVEDDVVSSFQTHKGRHWQTNSLFRAGLAASIVNKWMGRTDSQGNHYDHQTARERALKVGELMLSEQSRFLGALPERVRSWASSEIPIQDLQAQLTLTLQTAHYGPLGFCVRDVNLKPCEYHLKCLTGNKGLGCREFVFDLHDPTQRQNIEAERDKAENELGRLFEVMNRPDVPVESVEMHIEHQMTIYRNTTSILERSELILTQSQAHEVRDFQPFRAEGSKPDDCAFQCGGEL